MPFPVITRIETARTVLRPVAENDLADLFEVNGDDRVTEFLPYASWKTRADALAWLARVNGIAASGTGQQLVLMRKPEAKVIGAVLLFRYEEPSARVELGYVLGSAHWRQGLMQEAVVATCDHLFGTLGMRRIEAEANPENLGSCGLLRHVGFTLEGRLRQRWVSKGRAHDTNIFSCLAHEWLAKERRT